MKRFLNFFKSPWLPVTVMIILLSYILWNEAEATEPVDHSGFIGTEHVSTKTITKGKETTTTGYIGTKPIRLKTTETKSGKTTTGWVDDRYVRVKEKPKDQRD
jgi:hypothetical protein